MTRVCSRVTNDESLDRNARDFDAAVDPGARWAPSYNVAPTRPMLVVGVREGARVVRTLRWGLVPPWAKDASIGARCVNARAETLGEKPAFRGAFAARRCVALVTGWYEWKRAGGPAAPWWFHAAEGAGRVMALAALWEAWRDPATGELLRTCAVVTCPPNRLVAAVHDRMPAVLDAGGVARWLDRSAGPNALRGLLVPCPDEALAAWEVDRRVGDPRHDDPSLIEPARRAA